MDFKKAVFIKSVPSIKDAPEKKSEILFVGRSNVGKSSLLNALTKRKNLAYTSSKPGHTKMLNYYLIDDKFYFVDAPGYGFTRGGGQIIDSYAELMESYFAGDRNIKGIILIFDARRSLNEEDLDLIAYIKEKNIPYIIVLSKIDKCNQKETYAAKKGVLDLNETPHLISSLEGKGLEEIKSSIVSFIN